MEIIVTPGAQKQLEKIPKIERKKIQRKLIYLESDSMLGKKLSGEFKTSRSLRAWPYRIVYQIFEKPNRIYITSILHRQGAYKP